MEQDFTSYYLQKEEPNQSCFIALRDIILEQDENIYETRKWGAPCFCYKSKMFCFLSTDKKTNEPYLLMVEGRNLENPHLEAGNRKRMKSLPINPNKDLPIELINEILEEALDLYRNGIIKS